MTGLSVAVHCSANCVTGQNRQVTYAGQKRDWVCAMEWESSYLMLLLVLNSAEDETNLHII